MNYTNQVTDALSSLDGVRTVIEQLEYALEKQTRRAEELVRTIHGQELALDSCRRIMRELGHQSE